MARQENGFTLIELLVVVAVIGLLSSVLLVAMNTVQQKSRTAKAQADLLQISKAINLLALDTGKWPNGCMPDHILAPAEGTSNEVHLNAAASGLRSKPTVGPTDALAGCDWTAESVAKWQGPYISTDMKDPWGSNYWFDNDYHPLKDCPVANTNPDSTTTAAVVSLGPDRLPIEPPNYNCDDIYLILPGDK